MEAVASGGDLETMTQMVLSVAQTLNEQGTPTGTKKSTPVAHPPRKMSGHI